MIKILKFSILLLVLFLPSETVANEFFGKVSKLTVKNIQKNHIVSFSLTNIPNYKAFTLKDPNRLVVDFRNNKIDSNLKYIKSPIFKSIRKSSSNDGSRAVFDLNNEFHILKSTVLNPTDGNKSYILKIELGLTKKSVKTKGDQTPLNSVIADSIISQQETTIKSTQKSIKRKFSKSKSKPIQRKRKKHVVVIDAGHGGKDPGAIGVYRKTKEKNVTLSYAREIKRYLEKNKNFKVYLTRYDDKFISLGGRVKKSQKLKADLFISIHADSAENRKATGLSIYTLSEKSSDKEAAKLAQKENKSDIIGGINFEGASGDILKILIALSQRSTMNHSAKFAEFAIRKLSRSGIKVKQHTHRFAGFRVLTAPDVPSVLIELGYLSNKNDEKKLNSTRYRRKFASIMNRVIVDYFKTNFR